MMGVVKRIRSPDIPGVRAEWSSVGLVKEGDRNRKKKKAARMGQC